MAASIQAHYFSVVDFRGKSRYKRNLSGHFSGFKLATSTIVLPILSFYHTSHIPQALHFRL